MAHHDLVAARVHKGLLVVDTVITLSSPKICFAKFYLDTELDRGMLILVSDQS